MNNLGLIAVDWGTSSLRSVRFDQRGHIVARTAGGPGILSVPEGQFGQVLAETVKQCGGEAHVPVLMSGMIGSRQGWVEVPYCACPTPIEVLADNLHPITSATLGPIFIVPGLSVQTGAAPDVMRGEETQIIGALDWQGERDGVFVLPGTHSKWAVVRDSKIERFATYMTGEVFAALTQHTILGRLLPTAGSKHNSKAFTEGVHHGAANGAPGALLNRIFATRTLGLFERISSDALGSYLSGLLIGAELMAAMTDGNMPKMFTIVASAPELAAHYSAAAHELGFAATLAPPDCAARGALRLARAAGLTPA